MKDAERDIQQKTEAPAETPKEEMVPKASYDDLYKKAVELQARYAKLSELYNILVEKYLSGK